MTTRSWWRSGRNWDDGPAHRITTALAVAAVTAVSSVISYRHALELVSTYGRPGWPPGWCGSPRLPARLVPLTGLIVLAGILIIDASSGNQSVPPAGSVPPVRGS